MNGDRVHEGYTYVTDKQSNNITYLKCKDTRLHHCKGRAKIVAGVLTPMTGHNHPADENAELVEIFRHELKQACMVCFDKQKAIYDELRILHPEVSVIVTYPSIESSMRRWRKTIQPPIPHTLREYAGILEDPQWQRLLEYNRGRVQCVQLSATDLSVSVVFGDINFISQISDCTEIFVDATYKVVPAIDGAYQLLTVMATKYDHTLPFAWALMGRKSKSAYDCVLTYLKLVLAPDMAPVSFMTDFEHALQSSLSEVFVEATPHGCFFHYRQAVYRKARSLYLADYLANNAEAKTVLKKVMALALLTAELIAGTFGTVMNTATADVRRTLAEFFAYYDRQWLRRVTPALFSVHGLVRRTNNCVESYHKVLLDKIAPHPNIWDFTRKLMNIQSAAHADLLSLQQGRRVTRTPKLGYVLNHQQIVRAWQKLDDGRITTVEFVQQASNFVHNLVNNLGHAQAADDLDGPELNEAVAGVPEAVAADDQLAVPEEPVPAEEDEANFRLNVIEHDEPVPEEEGAVGGVVVISDDEEDNAPELALRDLHDVPPPNIEIDAAGYDALCCVCRDRQSTCLSMPCFHLVLCSSFANQILRTARAFEGGNNDLFGRIRCPYCNLPATEFRKVNMPQV